jgi:peptidoglycan/LPS O-acetylase OafA/YrhL
VTTTTARRDRYIDVLRAAALIRVVTFHAFGWAWLPLIFPSMGIMFALAGVLVAGSLDRAGSMRAFYSKRLRRLLLPLWMFGVVMLGVMSVLGWHVSEEDGSTALTWDTAWLWVLPLADPPASSQGYLWVLPLWYIRTYLWLVLLSPPLLWLFRRWPLRVMGVPVVALVLMTAGLVMVEGRAADVALQLCVYAGCWLLGFAHHDGLLRHLPVRRVLAGGVFLMAIGGWYAWSHQQQYGATSIDNIPVANMLYSLGAVLLLLRIRPQLGWLHRVRALDGFVNLFSSRAMTIYLWGNFAIGMAPFVVDRLGLARYDTGEMVGAWLRYAAAWALILVAVLLVGWVEDVAADRQPRLLPLLPSGPPTPDRVGAERSFRLSGNVVVDQIAPGQVAPALPRREAEQVTALVDESSRKSRIGTP